jgi:hypothetical protein
LKRDAFVTEQDPQTLVRDVVDHPIGHQEVRELDRLQVKNGRPCSTGFDFAIFLISRRSGRVKVRGRPPAYFGYSESNPSALKLRMTSQPGPRW